jgi:hypothetical protein
LRDLTVDGVDGPGDRGPHALEVLVGTVDVLLFCFELGMRHGVQSRGPRRDPAT